MKKYKIEKNTVQETLVIPLYGRWLCSQRYPHLFQNENAAELMERIDYEIGEAGIHVNTVRLYEKCALMPKPERLPNGYRVFTDLHVEQFKLARAALRVEVLHNGLRKQAVNIIKVFAAGSYEEAAVLTRRYIQQVDQERKNADYVAGQIEKMQKMTK